MISTSTIGFSWVPTLGIPCTGAAKVSVIRQGASKVAGSRVSAADEARGQKSVTKRPAAGGGGGDVVGPSSALDNELCRFDATTGKLIQAGSGALLSDAGTLTLPSPGKIVINLTGAATNVFDAQVKATSDTVLLASTWKGGRGSGVGGAGLGIRHLVQLENDAGSLHDAAKVEHVWDDATDGSEDGRTDFSVMRGGSFIRQLRLDSAGVTIGGGTTLNPKLTFNHTTTDSSIAWNGANARFEIANTILMATTTKMALGATTTYLYQPATGELKLVTPTTDIFILSNEIQLNASDIKLNGRAHLAGAEFKVSGNHHLIEVDPGAIDSHIRFEKGGGLSVVVESTLTDTMLVTHFDTAGSGRAMWVAHEIKNTVSDSGFHMGLNGFAYGSGTADLTRTSTVGGLLGGGYGARWKSNSILSKGLGVWSQVRIEAGNTGTITDAYNFYSEAIDAEDGTITNAYGLRVVPHVVDTGTLANAYGIRVDEQVNAATINYEIFLEGAGEIYFRDGDLRIGSASDGHLTLTADVRIDLTPTTVDQSSTTAAIPPLIIDQADISEEMFELVTTIGTGNAMEAIGAKTLTTTHFIKVTIPGGLTRYIPCGTIA